MRSIYLKGTTIIELGTAYVALAVIATLFNTFAALTYRKQS
jgi:ABC-2 type transport system permease protein